MPIGAVGVNRINRSAYYVGTSASSINARAVSVVSLLCKTLVEPSP